MAVRVIGVDLRREICARDLRVINMCVTEAMGADKVIQGSICPVRREGCSGKSSDGHQQLRGGWRRSDCKGLSEE